MEFSANKAVLSSYRSLPSVFLTRDGVEFCPTSPIWTIESLVGTAKLDFTEFENLSGDIIYRLKSFLMLILKDYSHSYSFTILQIFQLFYREVLSKVTARVGLIELEHVLLFSAILGSERRWKLSRMRILCRKMIACGLNVFSEDAANYLDITRIPGNIKGTSVRTRDSKSGAFSDQELLKIQTALNRAYSSGEITLHDFALAWIFIAYGCRSLQIAALKEGDLLISEYAGDKRYALRIPRVKQRRQMVRTDFTTRYCGREIGALIEKLIATNAKNTHLKGVLPSERPLFPGDNIGTMPNLYYHMSSAAIRTKLVALIRRISGIHGNPKRFRITLAQRAVDQGKDKYTVAELLDHSDTQNIHVYYEASPSFAERLDASLSFEMALVAQAFCGTIVSDERDATRGEDPTSRIYDRSLIDNVDSRLGNCGSMSFCQLAAPYACYMCPHFEPWIDGPHKALLNKLIEEREQMRAAGISQRVFGIRDATIVSIAEVIRICEAMAVR